MSLANREPVIQIGRSRTPTRVAVTVVDGDVQRALRELKKASTREGLYARLSRRSTLYFFMPPGARKRLKSKKARSRQRKVEAKMAAYELRRDPHGKRPHPREEVIAAAAA